MKLLKGDLFKCKCCSGIKFVISCQYDEKFNIYHIEFFSFKLKKIEKQAFSKNLIRKISNDKRR